jgi:predicted anti-sigma-YlaC factor YlaD
MNCEREPEILQAIMDGRWPDGSDPELRAHASKCGPCSELITVAGAIRADHQEALAEAAVPPSSLVWRRAQRRAREEAVREVTRAITAVQTGALAAAVVVGAALIGGIGALLAHISDGIHFGALDFVPDQNVMLFAAVATCVLFAPVAVWMFVAED